MSRDRDLIRAISEVFKEASIDAHASGMSLCRRSARLEQLSRMLSDKKCTALVRALIREGLVTMAPDGETKINSLGGKS